MKLDPQERLVPVASADGRPFWLTALAIIVAIAVAGGIALTVLPQARDGTKGLVFAAGEALGVKPPEAYSAVYQRFGMTPLPARLLGNSQISAGLARLTTEPCGKTAIFAFGEALLGAHEERRAADAYAGFAAACPNGEGEQFRAAQILFGLGDSDKVITITSGLVDRNPGAGPYHYLRGRALTNAKRYAEAVADYTSTIELQKNPRDVGEWVFVEMANIYAAMNRPCDAATTILAWVAIDPSERDTMNARKMVEAYSAKGCAPERPSVDVKKL
jgi:tetratricopeptide (TPR) repeat protein